MNEREYLILIDRILTSVDEDVDSAMARLTEEERAKLMEKVKDTVSILSRFLRRQRKS